MSNLAGVYIRPKLECSIPLAELFYAPAPYSKSWLGLQNVIRKSQRDSCTQVGASTSLASARGGFKTCIRCAGLCGAALLAQIQ